MEESKHLLNLDNIRLENIIGEGRNTLTYLSKMLTDSTQCASKIIKNEDDENDEIFLKYIEMLEEVNHPGIIPFLGFCKSNENKMKKMQ